MSINYMRLHRCTKEEKDSAMEVVDLIRSLSSEARKNGLLHLENIAGIDASEFLEKAVKLVVSGAEPKSVQRILATYIQATELSDIEYFRRILMMDGMLLIQQGANPDVLMEHLCAYFGETYIKKFAERESKEVNVQEQMGIYLKEEVDNTNSPELDQALKTMELRSMQRLLRECSLTTINIACAGASRALRQKIVQCIAMAQWSNYLSSTEMFHEISLKMIRGSQDAIIREMHHLRKVGEIL